MAKRVFEISKALGVTSKEIIAKCRAEGIGEDTIKNHMSSVSVGLEATITEWFTEHEEGTKTTAVETAEPVDLRSIRARAKKKTARAMARSAEESAEESVGTDVAVAEPPARAARRAKAVPRKETEEAVPAAPSPEPEPGAAPTAFETPVEAPEEDAPPLGAVETEEAPAIAAAAEQPEEDVGGVVAPAAEKQEPIRPAPMNVPRRPKVVTPAGPKLTEQAPVRLAGPKVVRIEAPERVEAPRPRRAASAGPSMPVGPAAPDAGADDRSRSPRRAGGKRAGAGAGRSTRRSGADRSRGGAGAWRQQDLIEREARLQRAGGFMKKRRQEAKQRAQAGGKPMTPAVTGGGVKIKAPFTIRDLSEATGVQGSEIVKKLFMQLGVMATINSGIDPEQAQEIMMDWDIELEVTEAKTAVEIVEEQFAERDVVDERPRGPVVTILGHVDHGKTSLLDRIRNANVAEGEAGGITQATSAFKVPVKFGGETKQIVFVDTPGHQAFTAMRARGANITDIVVLVVAADDGVMPQTVESINHAKAAGVPIVVALNKMDKPEATANNIQKILGQLAEHELNPVEWGGTTEVVRTSAVKNEGIQDLLETLDYQAQLLELKADFGGTARGTVVESRIEEGRGPTANILLQDGMLKVGDFIVAGRAFGRVRDITSDRGARLKEVLPPTPVQISGIDELPEAGDKFYIVKTLKQAQEAAEHRRERDRQEQLALPKVTLDTFFSQMAESEVKEILIVLKADVQGSLDVLKNEIERVSTPDVKARVLHAAVGGITETDVLLADASHAVIIGFNVIPGSKARQIAEQKSVEIRTYQVIYDIVDDVKAAAEGLLEPEFRYEVLGHAEVRKVFRVSKVGSVAGCYVTDGVVQRDALIRVTREDVVIENDRVLEQLKRFKDDAKEVRAGIECGMKIAGYDDIKEGDVLECYKQVEVKRTL